MNRLREKSCKKHNSTQLLQSFSKLGWAESASCGNFLDMQISCSVLYQKLQDGGLLIHFTTSHNIYKAFSALSKLGLTPGRLGLNEKYNDSLRLLMPGDALTTSWRPQRLVSYSKSIRSMPL